MIFDEVVMHNFGVYLGRQSARLTPPSPKQPIVLLGGLNGGGKTTMLDALQLALYGKFARCSNRKSLAYDEFLRRCVHRSADPQEGAAVELHFRYVTDGEEHAYRVHRSWVVNKSGVKETVEVLLDGEYDPVLTESWHEAVEGFIPLSVSQLFFFDGEKIEQLADLKHSAQLLAEATYLLLGGDVIEQLAKDLGILEQRKKIALKDELDQQRIEKIKREVEEVRRKRETLKQERAVAQNDLEGQKKSLRETDNQYRLEGGGLFDRRKEIENKRSQTYEQLQNIETELRELAAGPAPLLLVQDLLAGIEQQDIKEQEAAKAYLLDNVLTERDSSLVAKIKKHSESKELLASVEKFLLSDREERTKKKTVKPYLQLDDQVRNDLHRLLYIGLSDTERKAKSLLKDHERVQQELDNIDRQLAEVPEEDKIAEFVNRRKKLQAEIEKAQSSIAVLDAELDRIKNDISAKEALLSREIEKSVEIEFAQEDAKRIIEHSGKVRDTLNVFRQALVKQHIGHIERLVLDSFRQLLRKESLVADLRISPDDFQLELRNDSGEHIFSDRLSAGERQLLAVSLLWGLARASGRPLPIVVDTPLGRLDASHRTHLVERYFPNASHQVLLLSTDEEIDEKYYPKLKSQVGHSYTLEFDDKLDSTQIKPGYFW